MITFFSILGAIICLIQTLTFLLSLIFCIYFTITDKCKNKFTFRDLCELIVGICIGIIPIYGQFWVHMLYKDYKEK